MFTIYGEPAAGARNMRVWQRIRDRGSVLLRWIGICLCFCEMCPRGFRLGFQSLLLDHLDETGSRKGRDENMITITYAITTLVVLTAAYIVLKKALGAYLKFRGARIISCPETCEPAAVEVDTGR